MKRIAVVLAAIGIIGGAAWSAPPVALIATLDNPEQQEDIGLPG